MITGSFYSSFSDETEKQRKAEKIVRKKKLSELKEETKQIDLLKYIYLNSKNIKVSESRQENTKTLKKTKLNIKQHRNRDKREL